MQKVKPVSVLPFVVYGLFSKWTYIIIIMRMYIIVKTISNECKALIRIQKG